ncbi:protein trapped in endoderm-1-like [Macrobrachium rosenbergii]|uniref:protein trapped in endoderm-1-like n=1 Tax=Macrobrachium rosenbergii TaxID=79674 RepID=UPI0034D63787
MEGNTMQSSSSSPVSQDTESLHGRDAATMTDSILHFKISICLANVVALAANAFMVVSIIKSKTLRKKRSTHFIVSFLLSSAASALGSMDAVVLSLIDSSVEEEKTSSSAWSTVLFGLVWTFGISHYFTSCALALTRLMAMMWPVKYQKLMSSKVAGFLIVLPWMLAALICIPAFFGVMGKPDTKTLEYKPGHTRSENVTAMAYMATTVGGPVLTACSAYVAMFIQASRSQSATRSHEHHNNHRISQWKNGITRALLASIIIHVSCNIPHVICHAVDSFNNDHVLKAAIHFIYTVQFILDPLMFFIFAQEYRKASLELLNPTFRRGQRSTPASSESYGASKRFRVTLAQNTQDL